jgi:3'-phosphoadenosine 5'-phosphosulfate sulfotransferase (PAPS reductase)/FAD synthetase
MTCQKQSPAAFDEASCRHILSLSGGKDSTALALYMRDRVPQMEYVFCDTGEELAETYDYLLKIEAQLVVSA